MGSPSRGSPPLPLSTLPSKSSLTLTSNVLPPLNLTVDPRAGKPSVPVNTWATA